MQEKEPPPMPESIRPARRRHATLLFASCFAAFAALSACAGVGAPVPDLLPAAGGIMAGRAAAAAPERDAGVLLVAHGMGAEGENDRLLALMERSAQELRTAGHPEVRTATLREDWTEARAVAEDDIRSAVEEMRRRHGRVVVLPYRLYGFGPYADVLDGLAYESGPALLPHPLITEWVAERATSRFCAAGLPSPLASCALSANPAQARAPTSF